MIKKALLGIFIISLYFVVELDSQFTGIIVINKNFVMKTIIELTEEQFKILLDKYYENPNERSKLITTKVNNIARRLNKK